MVTMSFGNRLESGLGIGSLFLRPEWAEQGFSSRRAIKTRAAENRRSAHRLHSLAMQTVVVAFSTFIAICPVALAGSAEANGCDSPPVTTAEQAVCLARADLSTGWLGPNWKQLKAEAFRHDESRWVVEFRDTRPGVLGGGGRVTVDVNSGKVTERRGDR